MYSFDEWMNHNKPVLDSLFMKLYLTCEEYGIHLTNDNESHKKFYLMMYNESTKEIVDRELYSEFFHQNSYLEEYESDTK